MKFTLGNYEKPSVDLSLPEWAKNETVKRLYAESLNLYEKIKADIEEGNKLPLKSRKIVVRRLALLCDVDHSLITARRYPELVRFIEEKNSELDACWASVQAGVHRSGRKRTKNELMVDYEQMKKEVDRLSNLKIAEALEFVIAKDLVSSKSVLIAKIEDLELSLHESREQLFKLKQQNRELLTALSNKGQVIIVDRE